MERCLRRCAPWACLFAACATPTEPIALPELDRCFFVEEVHPVLARDCGFVACHGDARRFFRVYAVGRLRLEGIDDVYAPIREEELTLSYERARAVAISQDPEDPTDQVTLLQKPLKQSGHRGLDDYQRNVYASEDEEGYQILLRWLRGEEATCP